MTPEQYQDFYGDQTRWFIGKVVSIEDPMQLGRIRVRIHGIHTDNTQEIPDDGLPWAQTIVPITEGGTNGLGNITGIQPNARVFGIFLDGANSQLPLILGSLPKLEESSAGGRSTDQRIRGGDDGKNSLTITKKPNSNIGEPDDPYAAVYPNNAVHRTPSGHVIELDDTEDAERIHIYHRSGTHIEMHPNGDVVTHHKNGFRTVTGNDKLEVTENMEIKVGKDLKITVGGNMTQTVTGNETVTVGKDQTVTTGGKIFLN